MESFKSRIAILESEIDKLISLMHEMKQKNNTLLKENDDLKNKLIIFESDISNQKSDVDDEEENKELIKLKEKQERIKSELDGIIEHINSVLN